MEAGGGAGSRVREGREGCTRHNRWRRSGGGRRGWGSLVLLHGLFVLFGLALLLFTEIRVARDEKGERRIRRFMEVEQLAMESKELDEVPAGHKKEEEVEAEEDQIGDPIE